MFRSCYLTAAIGFVGLLAGAHANEGTLPSPNRHAVEEFRLCDGLGIAHALSDFKESRVVVLAFLGTECPLAKRYGTRLAQFQATYPQKDVAFLGIDSNRQDSAAEIAAYARSCGIPFPVLKDLHNKLADRLGALRTPEIFVLDRKRVIRYHGRIDDQFGVGYVRNEASHAFLKTAIDELLAGKAVTRSETDVVGCFIGRMRPPDASAKATYCNQVARILNKRCVSCHRPGEIAPFALTSYEEASGWADTIAEVVRDRRMPPWFANPEIGHFVNDCSLPEVERQTLCQWAAAGAPQGDPRKLPPTPKFVEGWQLPRKPDKVFNITAKSFHVPGQGAVAYQYFNVDPQFTEDKWIQGLEVRPGNRAVVHHIMVVAHPKKSGPGSRRRVKGDQCLLSFVPGGMPMVLPPGLAKLFPAGFEFLFEVHYTPVGSPQTDQSRIGVIFADPKEVTHCVRWIEACDLDFVIPPRAADYPVEADSVPIRGTRVQLLQLYPHMHLRGKSFRYEARYPNGSSEVLLDVPHYDFGWQLTYRLASPKSLPRGTVVHATARYDNSADNRNNPDPNATVREGDQTWEEMMVGNFEIMFPATASAAGRGRDASASSSRGRPDAGRTDVADKSVGKAGPPQIRLGSGSAKATLGPLESEHVNDPGESIRDAVIAAGSFLFAGVLFVGILCGVIRGWRPRPWLRRIFDRRDAVNPPG